MDRPRPRKTVMDMAGVMTRRLMCLCGMRATGVVPPSVVLVPLPDDNAERRLDWHLRLERLHAAANAGPWAGPCADCGALIVAMEAMERDRHA